MKTNTIKRTYALDQPVVRGFEQAVLPGKRSAVISQMMKEFLEQREREVLRKEIVAGCHDMADTYLEMENEFNPLEEEAGRALSS
jgi:metal-responsive CopG/Arc/MetJ family transcriptional regulator